MKYYRENYREKGMFQITPYEKSKPLWLNFRKHMMSSLLRQNQRYSQKILSYLDFTDYFKGIYGADLENKRGEKAAVLAYALEGGWQYKCLNDW